MGQRARLTHRTTGLAIAAAMMAPALAADVSVREVSEALFKASETSPVDFAGRDLSELDLAGLNFKGARLSGVNFYGADLSDVSLAGADLKAARLDRATITRAEFSSANLEGATLLRPSVFSGLAPDVREAPRFLGARLAKARIFGRLDFADFRWADLSGASLVGTDGRDEQLAIARGSYRGANFTEATLAGAILTGSNFYYAKFQKADLRGADLRDTDLTRADFTGADLTGADVTGADFDEAVVSDAKGLESLKGLASAKNVDRLVR